VILYNQSGEVFAIFQEDWWEFCETAQRHGWKPAGTERPPIRLDIDHSDPSPQEPWNHDYRVPQQQTVLRHDAKALAAALRRVDDPGRLIVRKAFIDFCDRGGFILCAGSETPLGILEKSIREAGEPVLDTASDLQKVPSR
jgi:hypothetical protein